jgi:hypothetical protein
MITWLRAGAYYTGSRKTRRPSPPSLPAGSPPHQRRVPESVEPEHLAVGEVDGALHEVRNRTFILIEMNDDTRS